MKTKCCIDSPKLAPCNELTALLSNVKGMELLATNDPNVKPALRVRKADCDGKHSTHVSDIHNDFSHAVCPTRRISVNEYRLKPSPEMLTGTSRFVPAEFCPRILSPTMSADHACVKLPSRAPAVITTQRVPRAPLVTRHLTDVSDFHAVASQSVCATRALPV